MTSAAKATIRGALVLLAFTVAGTALLALTFGSTKDIIAKNEEREKLVLISQVLPPSFYDNDLLADVVTVPPSSLLGTETPTTVYRARLKGNPAALVFEAIAPDGYNGKIRLLIAVRADGTLAGVRVVAHNETPGLGDYIDAAKSKWIEGFTGKSLSNPPEAAWRVKKDAGDFDYVAGATISPRAVVKAVARALKFYGEQKEVIFRPMEALNK